MNVFLFIIWVLIFLMNVSMFKDARDGVAKTLAVITMIASLILVIGYGYKIIF